MRIVEFATGTLRFLDELPARVPENGFVWIYLDREQFPAHLETIQLAAQRLGGSPLHELHVKDLANRAHPSRRNRTMNWK